MPLLPGNVKVGQSIWHWALPAGDSCPGKTEACFSACYARKGHYRFANVQRRMAINDQLRKREDFVRRVSSQCTLQGIQLVRIHSAGDFDTIPYVRQWAEIARRAKLTTFFAYTRSWRNERTGAVDEEFVEALTKLAALNNVQLWFSCDQDTGRPPTIDGIPLAYLSRDDSPAPYPVDLVFRERRSEKRVTIGGVLVCPAERIKFTARVRKVTCQNCRLCFERTDWLHKRNALPVLST